MSESNPRDDAVVESAFLGRVLAPYFPHCRYLKSALVRSGEGAADGSLSSDTKPALCHIDGEFSIAASCYIEDTGHLNSVEANICFNQMLYALYAEGIQRGLIPALKHLSVDEYLARQLPDVLITRMAMVFKRAIKRENFRGSLTFLDATERRGMILFRCVTRFEDSLGGIAQGKVSVVFDDRAQAEFSTGSGQAHG